MNSLRLVPLFLFAFGAAACASANDGASATAGGGGAPREGSVKGSMLGRGGGSSDGEATFSRDDDPPMPRGEQRSGRRATGATPVRVTWEALAVELDKMKNPRFQQKQQLGFAGTPEYRVVLLNESHPDASVARRRTKEAEVAILSDEDMQSLLQGLRSESFFKFSRPTGSVERLFQSERSRGRITVEQGDESVTLLSQQGLGLDASTRAIPGIYAQAKAAISIMKNRTSSLSVKTFTADGAANPGYKAPSPTVTAPTPKGR